MTSRPTNSRTRNLRKTAKLPYQELEKRQLLAFFATFDPIENVRTFTQTDDDGPISLTLTSTNVWGLSDGNGTIGVSNVNVQLNLQNHANNDLTIQLDADTAGFVEINLGNVDRDVALAGSGSIVGDLTITGGSSTGDQHVTLDGDAADIFEVAGETLISLGAGRDRLTVRQSRFDGPINYTAHLNVTDVERVNLNDTWIDGYLDFAGNPSEVNALILESSTVEADISFVGGDEFDIVGFEDSGSNGGIQLEMGDGGSFFDMGNLVQFDRSYTSSGLVLTAGTGTDPDTLEITDSSLTGFIDVDLGDGPNQVDILNTFMANDVRYQGGSGVDEVTYQTTGIHGIEFTMGQGIDQLSILGENFDDVYVDMESANPTNTFAFEQFTHNLNGRAITFPIEIRNWNGFNHTFVDNLLTSEQTLPTPDVTLTGSNLLLTRLDLEGHTTMDLVGSTDLQMKMLDNSGSSLTWSIELLTGDAYVSLGDGDRTFTMIGDLPEIDGRFNLSGGQGSQHIESFGGKFGDLAIDLGENYDVIEDLASLIVSNRVNLTNIEDMDIGGTLSNSSIEIEVGGDFYVDVRDPVANPSSSAAIFGLRNASIQGNFGFFGNDQLSDQLYMDAINVSGNFYVDLGATINSTTQILYLGDWGSIGGNVTVFASGSANSVNAVLIEDGPASGIQQPLSISGNTFINLGRGRNEVFVSATFGSVLNYVASRFQSQTSLTVAKSSSSTRINAVLGAEDDVVNILPTDAEFADVRIDFRGGDDRFENRMSANSLEFKTRFLNLHGYSIFGLPNILTTHFEQVSNESGPLLLEAAEAEGSDIWQLGGGATLSSTANLSARMLSESETDVNITLNRSVSGSVRLNLGNGARGIEITNGTSDPKPIKSSLRIHAADGNQYVRLNSMSAVPMGAEFRTTIDLGTGGDTLQSETGYVNGGSFIANGLNFMDLRGKPMTVGFNTTFSTVGDDLGLDTQFRNWTTANAFNFFGGNQDDVLRLYDFSAGATFIDLGIGVAGQRINVEQSQLQSLAVTTGSGSQSSFYSHPSAQVSGNVIVNFRDAIRADIVLNATVTTGDIQIRGSDGDDAVTVGWINSPSSSVLVNTFAGSDTVALLSQANIDNLFINFGLDDDTFDDGFAGEAPFEMTLLNLP